MARSGTSVAGLFVGVALVTLFGTMAVWAQVSAPPQPQGQPPQGAQGSPPSAPPPEEKPGLFGDVGKLFNKLPSLLPPPGTTGEVGESLSRLATPAIMETGRVACPVSAGGAPDCKLAANQLCQSKGHKEGNSLNTDATEKCSPKVFIPGRQRKPDDCRTDTYVTRALCQ
ncbi:MAG: hypothetical protein FWD68_05065 [Alphaproteobacteria bacterium]|nr:hypothetical protein [Alphaproteobacteria bacterium]